MGGACEFTRGADSRLESNTGLLFVSGRVKCGAFWPARGAAEDAGNCLVI